MPDFQIAIIGGGVVGLAIAERLSRTRTGIVLLEKNQKYGMETSSRNSEVIHAGIYYPQGTLRAVLCVEGKEELYSLCTRHNIPHQRCGKIITATTDAEVPELQHEYENGMRNGVELQLLDSIQVHTLEPHVRSVAGIFSPSSGIISAHALMDYLYHTAVNQGVMVQHRSSVHRIEHEAGGYRIAFDEAGSASSTTAEVVINAAGLYADRVAESAGIDIDAAGYRMVFAKGMYFALVPQKRHLINRLVYPVPPKESLGVHVVIDVGGRVRFGPDCEYLPERIVDYTVNESKRKVFGAAVNRMFPDITEDDLTPDMRGIRPKLQQKGEPQMDWVIKEESGKGLPGFINLIGMESPALTSCLAIARHVESLL